MITLKLIHGIDSPWFHVHAHVNLVICPVIDLNGYLPCPMDTVHVCKTGYKGWYTTTSLDIFPDQLSQNILDYFAEVILVQWINLHSPVE